MQSLDDQIYVIKLVIIGDGGVGKSQILNRFFNHFFSEQQIHDRGLNFQAKIMFYKGKEVKLQLWSLLGDTRLRTTMNPNFYKGVNGIILNYDISNFDSFKCLPLWLQGQNNNKLECNEYAPGQAIKFLFGNKCDSKDRKVTYEEGKAFADNLGILFFETSAKENINIDESFKYITEQLMEKKQFIMGKRICTKESCF